MSRNGEKRFQVCLTLAHWELLSASTGVEWKGLNNIYDRDGRWMGSFIPALEGHVELLDAPAWVVEKCKDAFGESARVVEMV